MQGLIAAGGAASAHPSRNAPVTCMCVEPRCPGSEYTFKWGFTPAQQQQQQQPHTTPDLCKKGERQGAACFHKTEMHTASVQ